MDESLRYLSAKLSLSAETIRKLEEIDYTNLQTIAILDKETVMCLDVNEAQKQLLLDAVYGNVFTNALFLDKPTKDWIENNSLSNKCVCELVKYGYCNIQTISCIEEETVDQFHIAPDEMKHLKQSVIGLKIGKMAKPILLECLQKKDITQDTIFALVSLGYTSVESLRCLRDSAIDNLNTDDTQKCALKECVRSVCQACQKEVACSPEVTPTRIMEEMKIISSNLCAEDQKAIREAALLAGGLKSDVSRNVEIKVIGKTIQVVFYSGKRENRYLLKLNPTESSIDVTYKCKN